MKLSRNHPPRLLPRRLMAVDPGTTESAYVMYNTNTRAILKFGKVPNSALMLLIVDLRPERLVCEEIRSYGQPVGQTTFDTVRFCGNIEHLCQMESIPFALMPRYLVKKSLKPLPRRNDKEVRSSLITLYGDPGTRAAPGPTYGITKDVWAALGVAHAYRLRLIYEGFQYSSL